MEKIIQKQEIFYVKNQAELLYQVLNLGMKLEKIHLETEIYFTDLDRNFIKEGRELKIQKNEEEGLKVFIKTNQEKILDLTDKEEQNLEALFWQLGFYRYLYLEKTNKMYSKREDKITYFMKIENIKNLGSLIHFQLCSEKDNVDVTILEDKLERFISSFQNIGISKLDMSKKAFITKQIYQRNIVRNFQHVIIYLEDILHFSKEKTVKEMLEEEEVILNLKLLKELEQEGFPIVLVYSKIEVEKVLEIQKKTSFFVQELDSIQNFKLDEMLIMKPESNMKFFELAFIFLEHISKTGK